MHYRRRYNPYPQYIIYFLLLIVLIVAVITVKNTKPTAEASYASDAEQEDRNADGGEDRFYAPDPDEPQVAEDGTPLPKVIESGEREAFSLWESSQALTNEMFGIEAVRSSVDFDHDGRDDYADLLEGARAEAKARPVYNSHFYDGGYPPVGYGNSVDLVISAFKSAGYSLRRMFDSDIDANPDEYDFTYREPEVDFRIVRLIATYFERKAVPLTTDIDERAEWMPGDIVILGDNEVIGIVSERRNAYGRAYFFANDGSGEYEFALSDDTHVTAHYRFDASLLSASELIAWDDRIDFITATEPILDDEEEPEEDSSEESYDEGDGEDGEGSEEEPGEEIYYEDSDEEYYEGESEEDYSDWDSDWEYE